MADSSVPLNPVSTTTGPQVRTVTVPDSLAQTPDQGYATTHQQVVVLADEDGDTDTQTIPVLLATVIARLDDLITLVGQLAAPADDFDLDDDDASTDEENDA